MDRDLRLRSLYTICLDTMTRVLSEISCSIVNVTGSGLLDFWRSGNLLTRSLFSPFPLDEQNNVNQRHFRSLFRALSETATILSVVDRLLYEGLSCTHVYKELLRLVPAKSNRKFYRPYYLIYLLKPRNSSEPTTERRCVDIDTYELMLDCLSVLRTSRPCKEYDVFTVYVRYPAHKLFVYSVVQRVDLGRTLDEHTLSWTGQWRLNLLSSET